jgi:predicted acylesterase/phospholipase RssA
MKRALVISGGGSKGAFAVGILQQLGVLFPQLNFDIIVGTSTGALIAPLAAVKEIDLLEEIYTTHTTEQVVVKHRIGDRLNQKSIFTVDPLWQLIKKHMTDARFDQIVQSTTDIYIITTCLQTQGTVVFTTNSNPKSSSRYLIKTMQDAEHMRLAVLGSACQPVFMTPVKIDSNYGNGKEKEFQYVDGGVREYAGIQMAIDQGATEIFCILLSTGTSNEDDVEYTSLFPILQRTIAMFSEDVEKNDLFFPQQLSKALDYIDSVKQKMKADGIPQDKIDEYFEIEGAINPYESKEQLRLFIIRPEAPLGGGPGGLVFDPVEMQNMLSVGQGAAQNFVAKLDPQEVTWVV